MTANGFAQHHCGWRCEDARALTHLEKPDAGLFDAITKRTLHFDQVAVAGDHHGLIGNPITPSPTCKLDQSRGPEGLLLASVRKPISTVCTCMRLDAVDRVDGPGIAPVQTGCQIGRQRFPKAQHHPHFIRCDLRQSRPCIEKQDQSCGDTKHELAVMQQLVQALLDIEPAFQEIVDPASGRVVGSLSAWWGPGARTRAAAWN